MHILVMGKLSFEVIAGTYEEFLVGYNFSSKEQKLVQSFAAHDHTASVRCVAISGHYLATGGADDRIFIYDMKTRKEHCSLTHHNATINCIQFTENHSHLISGSADGVLAIVRVGNWQLEKIWEKAHKGAAILDVAVHSSGKMALTLGSDCTLCTWNLVKGRQAYKINLGNKSQNARALEKIVWAPDGVRFVLFGGKYAEIWSIETGGLLSYVEYEEGRVVSCIWKDDETLLVGLEDGQICVYDVDNAEKTFVKAHETRVKCLAQFKKWTISTSSSGEIKVWNKDFDELANVDTGCRLTCLCILEPIKVKKEESEENVTITETIAEKPKEVKAPRVRIILDEEEEEEETPKKKKKKGKKTSI